MIKTFWGKTGVLILLAAFIISSPVFSASKKKKKNKEPEPEKIETSAETQTEIDDTSYSIKLPTGKNQRDYFAKVNPDVLNGVQNGSPESIREAMALMRQKGSEYEECEKVLAVVSAEIMKLVWPSEKITWDITEVSDENP